MGARAEAGEQLEGFAIIQAKENVGLDKGEGRGIRSNRIQNTFCKWGSWAR